MSKLAFAILVAAMGLNVVVDIVARPVNPADLSIWGAQ
jgi:hypothetical protein